MSTPPKTLSVFGRNLSIVRGLVSKNATWGARRWVGSECVTPIASTCSNGSTLDIEAIVQMSELQWVYIHVCISSANGDIAWLSSS